MTFLLKSEVDSQTQRTKYEQLETKVDTLTKLLLPSASMTPHNNTQHLIIPQLSPYPTNTNADTQMQTQMQMQTQTQMQHNHLPQSAYVTQGGLSYPTFGTGVGILGSNDYSPHCVGDLTSTYMAAYASYIQADTPISSGNSNYATPNSENLFYNQTKVKNNIEENNERNNASTSYNANMNNDISNNNNNNNNYVNNYTVTNNNNMIKNNKSNKNTSNVLVTPTSSSMTTNTTSNTTSSVNYPTQQSNIPLGTSTSDWLFAFSPPPLSSSSSSSSSPSSSSFNSNAIAVQQASSIYRGQTPMGKRGVNVMNISTASSSGMLKYNCETNNNNNNNNNSNNNLVRVSTLVSSCSYFVRCV